MICAVHPCKQWDCQATAGLRACQKLGAQNLHLHPARQQLQVLLSSGAVKVLLRWKQHLRFFFLSLPFFSPLDNRTEVLVDWDCYSHASLNNCAQAQTTTLDCYMNMTAD